MNTLENLNQSYRRLVDLQDQYRNSLIEYLNGSLAFCKDGVAELSFKYKSWKEAEKDGEDFDDQFPVAITIEDKHSFNHEIYVTCCYKKNDLFYIDGYDRTDGEWIEGWYTDSLDSTYESLACFVNHVLNPETDFEIHEEVTDNGFVPQLIGYQLLDEDNCYPSEMSAWDVFATREDAEEYKQTMLDVNEWHIIEEWSTPNVRPSMFRYHRSEKRSFEKGEKVWVEEGYETYATLYESYEDVKPADQVTLIDLEDNVRFGTDADNLYKLADNKKCGFCGSDLYFNHKNDSEFKYFCPECKDKFKTDEI